MDCSPPGSSVHGTFQARILEWVAISFFRGSSQPRDQTRVSLIVGRHFTVWATGEATKDVGCANAKKIYLPMQETRCKFDPWVGKIPQRREWHHLLVFLPGKFHRQRSLEGCSLSSVAQLCPTLCDPMDCSMPGLLVHYQFPDLTQTHVHWVSDAIQPSHPLLSPSPPALYLSQYQGLFRGPSSSH